MESLRGSAVARVIQALNKKGRLYTAELSYETRVSPRHLSTIVLPEMVRDQIVIRHEEKNRVYYQLTEKGQMLALALENPGALADLYEVEETARAVRVEAPLLFDFFKDIRSLNARKNEVDRLFAQEEISGSEYRRRMSEMEKTESILRKRFERTKDELNLAMGRIEIPRAGFARLESFEDLLLLEEMEFAKELESMQNKVLAIKHEKTTLENFLKRLDELHKKHVLDDREYSERKSRYMRKLKEIEIFVNRLKACLEH